MDRAGFMGALLGSVMMPFAIFSGTLSVSGNPAGSELLYNKFLYSGLAFGLKKSYLIKIGWARKYGRVFKRPIYYK